MKVLKARPKIDTGGVKQKSLRKLMTYDSGNNFWFSDDINDHIGGQFAKRNEAEKLRRSVMKKKKKKC